MPFIPHYCSYLFTLTCYLIYLIYPLHANGWSVAANLSVSGQNASHPQLAIDSFGNATAVWYRFDGSHLVIQASTKPFGGKWQTVPDNLSLPDQDAFNPQIAIDFLGNITVVWEKLNGSLSTIEATSKYLGSGWQAPTQISYPGQNASNPQIAVDSFGHATAVWQAFNGSYSIIQASTRFLGKNWQAIPYQLSLSGQNAKNAQIVIDPYDIATVVWQASSGTHEVIQSSTREFPGDWQTPPDTIGSAALSNSHPQISSDSYGNVTVVWNQFNGDYGIVQAATKLYGEAWQFIPTTLSIPGHNAFSPQLTVDVFGHVTAVWESLDASKLKCIHSSTKSFGGSWQTCPHCLSLPGDHNVNPRIATDLSGNTIVVWNSHKGFTCIHVSKKMTSGNWQSPEIISSLGRSAFFPQVAFDYSGKATVIWVMQDSLSFIQAADG